MRVRAGGLHGQEVAVGSSEQVLPKEYDQLGLEGMMQSNSETVFHQLQPHSGRRFFGSLLPSHWYKLKFQATSKMW